MIYAALAVIKELLRTSVEGQHHKCSAPPHLLLWTTSSWTSAVIDNTLAAPRLPSTTHASYCTASQQLHAHLSPSVLELLSSIAWMPVKWYHFGHGTKDIHPTCWMLTVLLQKGNPITSRWHDWDDLIPESSVPRWPWNYWPSGSTLHPDTAVNLQMCKLCKCVSL